ncbi:helix-turn-helix transcriptional regulator [Parabacteroides pacaensis]|uniref:helix-turn-helix transcriptional regulator n=1 Tax=Parabacteroides pacaensis TaxID=2086575 RepID=UPI00131B75CC|nr:hypothetical protein [Parabacteroides pacaensis]
MEPMNNKVIWLVKTFSVEEIIKERIGIIIRGALFYAEKGEKERLFLDKVNKIIYGKEHSYTINWNELYPLMNRGYNDFIVHLQKRDWNLKEREVQLCCLLFLKLRASEIASLLNYSIYTIYKWTALIRKKINIKTQEDIASFLSRTFSEEKGL